MLKLFVFVCFSAAVLVDSIPLDESVIEGRIVGGNDTDITQFPHHIAVYQDKFFVCGGFIVSATHVVTGAICVIELERTMQLTIRAGSSNNVLGGVVVKVKTVHIHPKHDLDTADYDIAVLELETPLKLNNKTMKPIKLAAKEPTAGSPVSVSGWGCINDRYDEPETLQSVTFPVYDRTKCANIYKGYDTTITPRMMCAGEEGKSPYFGDSGGALVHKGEVVGVVSFGEGCGKKDLPGVFTNIANPEITKFVKETAKL